MIRYVLKCSVGHEFEAWFSKGADFDVQSKKGLIICADCGSKSVKKAIMAPAIGRTSNDKNNESAISELKTPSKGLSAELAAKLRSEISKNCEDVGDKFVDEARAIHYGEKDERPIYGQASPKQAAELNSEGIHVAPLPDILVPKPKSKLN